MTYRVALLHLSLEKLTILDAMSNFKGFVFHFLKEHKTHAQFIQSQYGEY